VHPESPGVVEFLQMLARAVQQYHTYPPTSPLCRSAIEACQRSLVQLGRDQLTFRVTPHELIMDEVPFGRGSIVEQELARRLQAAAIAQVTVDQSVSIRELAHFCNDLLASSGRGDAGTTLIERIVEHGVDHITLRAAYQPEVLEVRPPAPAICEFVAFQRQQRDQLLASGGHIDHLYPPDKGWVRVDPSVRFPSVSLVDLAVLADDPETLATLLIRLTDDDLPEGAQAGEALSQKFSDVATLFAALEPRVARVMFSKLARAVLDLDTERRQALLRRTILPSLLDGRIDGTVLRDFPDVDLAEALCLLLDLETAAPELVTTALGRLELGSEREAAVVPLVEQKLQNRGSDRGTDLGLDSHARKLVHVNREAGRSFAEFAAFDLSLDEQAAHTLHEIRERIVATDIVVEQLACLLRLIRLEPNPELVSRFAARAEPLLDGLERSDRWTTLASWLAEYRALAEGIREGRPDVAEVITARLAALCTVPRARKLLDLAERDDGGRMLAGRMMEALGPGVGPALLGAMRPGPDDQQPARETRTKAIMQVLCEHAGLVAPALVAALGQGDAFTDRIVVRVLGLAGAGYEAALGGQLQSSDQQTVRETLRSLARIGSAAAAALVSEQVRERRDWVAGAAEETLWHFPASEAQREVKGLLASREYVLQHPEVAARLLDRVAQHGIADLEPALRAAASLRYRFWNPPQMRLGRKAQALVSR
jgi:hypothetical protein